MTTCGSRSPPDSHQRRTKRLPGAGDSTIGASLSAFGAFCIPDCHGNCCLGDGTQFGHDVLAARTRWALGRRLEQTHRVLLIKLRNADRIDFSRVVADSSSVRAVHREKTGPTPTDRRKAGSKHHLLADAAGTPLNVILTGANYHDSTPLMPLLDRLQSIAGQRGRPLRKPQCIQSERGYDLRRVGASCESVGSNRRSASALSVTAAIWA